MRHLPLNGLSHFPLSYLVLDCASLCVSVWACRGLGVSGCGRVRVCGCVGQGAWDGCEWECVFAPSLICVLQANLRK